MILQTILLIAGIAALIGALVLMMMPRWQAAALAFAGLLMLHWSYFIAVRPSYLVFWGVAAAMVTGIGYMSPRGEIDGNRMSNVYLGAAALAGALLGMIVGARFMVLGVILGTIVGQIAYMRTPAGRWLRESRATAVRYFMAKGLPAIVTMAIMGVAIEGFIR